MKQGWAEKKLGDVCKIQIGRTPYRKNSKFWDKEKKSNNVWLSIADLEHGSVMYDSKEYVSNLGAEKFKITPKGTLMLTFKLTLGRVAFAGKNLLTNEAIASLINLDDRLDQRFLFYYFTFFDWDEAAKGDEKVKGKTLNKSKLQKLKIPIPPLPVQKQIVAKLDQCFEAIDKARANVAKNLENAKELFQSNLNDLFSQKSEGWKSNTIGDVCKKGSSNVSQNKIKNNSGKYPIYGAKGLIKNVDFYHQDKSYISIIKDGSGIGKVNIRKAKTSVIGTLQYILPNEDINVKFLYYFILGINFKKYSKGAAIPHIYFKDYKNEELIVPPLPVQKQIVAKLDQCFESTKSLESKYQQELNYLEELKKSILQKAFSGELVKN